MQPKGIFITGTDTGVGKTIVTAAVARYLKKSGVKVGVLKPVTSGAIVIDGKLSSEDAELLRWGASSTAPDADIAPYLFREPLAPAESASREGVTIKFEPILAAFQRLADNHDFLLVEGAGGFLVPLSEELLVADLAKSLTLPLLIVARPNLGTVNHALMTCECARARGIEVMGIVINGQSEHPDTVEEYAARLITRHSSLPVPAIFPYCSFDDQKQIVEKLSNLIQHQPLARFLLPEDFHEKP